jgi:hypothetical protein
LDASSASVVETVGAGEFIAEGGAASALAVSSSRTSSSSSVAEDDDVTVTRRPEKPVVEVVKELSGELIT